MYEVFNVNCLLTYNFVFIQKQVLTRIVPIAKVYKINWVSTLPVRFYKTFNDLTFKSYEIKCV